jgi:hypothetical protein
MSSDQEDDLGGPSLMKFSIASLGEEPADRFVPFVQLCELLGYDSFSNPPELRPSVLGD